MRPRDENTEADQLTNEVFDGFDRSLRLQVCWAELDLQVLEGLVRTRGEFEAARAEARELAKQGAQG